MSSDSINQDYLARRLKILAYIDEEIQEGRGSPTDRQISEALHISSTGDIHFHIQYMEDNDWIYSVKTKKGHRRTGSIRLTDLGLQKLQLQENLIELPPAGRDGNGKPADSQPRSSAGAPAQETSTNQLEEKKKNSNGSQKVVLDVGSVILSARISDRKALRTVTIPVYNLIAASFGVETHSSDFSLSGLGPESYLNISQDMLGRLKIDDLYALEVRGDSMIEAGVQNGDYVILKRTQTAENGDMCAVWIDGKEATLKYFYREEKRVRLEAANAKISPRLIGPSHSVVIQGKVVLVVRL